MIDRTGDLRMSLQSLPQVWKQGARLVVMVGWLSYNLSNLGGDINECINEVLLKFSVLSIEGN